MQLRTYSLALVATGVWWGSLIANTIPLLFNPWTAGMLSVILVPLSALALILLTVYVSRGYYGQVKIYRTVPEPATD